MEKVLVNLGDIKTNAFIIEYKGDKVLLELEDKSRIIVDKNQIELGG